MVFRIRRVPVIFVPVARNSEKPHSRSVGACVSDFLRSVDSRDAAGMSVVGERIRHDCSAMESERCYRNDTSGTRVLKSICRSGLHDPIA